MAHTSHSITSLSLPLHWPNGFTSSLATAGLKPSGKADLALLVCDRGATAAAVFTKNLVRAAPLEISRAHLKKSNGRCRALIVNSGCANAATGPEGTRRAEAVLRLLAPQLHCEPHEILVNSTGIIGVQLDTAKIEAALPTLVSRLAPGDITPFATGILTTDTRMKTAGVRVRDAEGRTAVVVGAVKGAGMIHPDMATLIGVITTDAAIDASALDLILREAVDRSFHRISIDGDTSTNDAIFALSSGTSTEVDRVALQEAFTEVALDLARQVVQDAEGFERGLEITVREARTAEEALQMARTVGQSLLVRTAVTGGDPNWGRILAAMGRAGVLFDPNTAQVTVNGLPFFVDGAPAQTDRAQLANAFSSPHVHLEINVRSGSASDRFLTCGLTRAYVEFNANYTT
ncbi:MAG: bifunctional glutamate N-acetyltransferase/amino-acid acetyltransferase ArgJ [Planctomycetota bacterium]|nr:bifunctional glutamate N-acetyltransferase/amino-acid acetyltransferase ArgJ [Planctomycetota bacterium]